MGDDTKYTAYEVQLHRKSTGSLLTVTFDVQHRGSEKPADMQVMYQAGLMRGHYYPGWKLISAVREVCSG